MALGLGACAPKKKSESVRSGRCARGSCETGATEGTQSGPGAVTSEGFKPQWGRIHKGADSQENFYYHLEGFVSVSINSYDTPSELGYVSGDMNDPNTGVWFWGDVKPQSGTAFNPNASQSLQLDTQSIQLRMVVWDSYAGKTDAAGNTIPEFPVDIRKASRAFVNGKQATITFADDYGWVEMNGTFDQNNFTGHVTYQNYKFWDDGTHEGKKGASGVLGDFTVPTCGFFHCQ
jgi:hypothetical protein